MYLGSLLVDSLVTFYLNTSLNGSAQDADSAPTYRVYENETATPLLVGTMSLLDGANTIGFYSEQFTISSGLGFEEDKSYGIYVQHVVGGVTGTSQFYFRTEVSDIREALNTIISTISSMDSTLTVVNTKINSLNGLVIVSQSPVGSTGNDTTHVHLDGLGADYGNDELNDYLLVINDDSTFRNYARYIDGWDAATELATVETLPFTPAGAGEDSFWVFAIRRGSAIDASVANMIADHVLRRPLASARSSSNGDPVTFRSILGAVSKLVNRWGISGTTLTVYEEDDVTAAGTQTLTATPGASPITQINTD